MSVLKRLEVVAKHILALVAAAFLFRPWRQRIVARPNRVLLVRVDARVGEALLTTPLLEALRALPSPPHVSLLVHQKVARVLEGHPAVDQLLGLDRGGLWLGPLAPGIRK